MDFRKFGIILLATLCVITVCHANEDDITPEEFARRSVKKHAPKLGYTCHPTAKISNALSYYLDLIQTDKSSNDISKEKAEVTCHVCELIVKVIQDGVESKKSEDFIAEVVRFVCIFCKFEDENVCTGIVSVFKDMVVTIAASIYVNPDGICGVIIGGTCGGPYNPSITNWTIPLLNTTKPPVVPPVPPQPGSPTLRVLHVTDIHLDLSYTEGLNTDCGEPICCRTGNGPPAPGVSGAGHWGDYRGCDIPLRLLENLFQYLAKIQDQFDFVFWTGDMPAHNVWHQTRDDQLEMLKIIQDLFLKYLPTKLVFPSVGNHESCPVNSFPPPFITGDQSIQWLYQPLSESWLNWLPADTLPTLLRGAFYTVSPYPGFRIISINDNYCASDNWWLLMNMTDPTGELAWLIDVLQAAEDKHEKVFILGHIPNSGCLKSWGWMYYKIINRYEGTIMAQFRGHTHSDEYKLYYDDTTNISRATDIEYVAPSVTTQVDSNPGFRIYTMDGNYTNSSWAILDHATYIMNLSLANAGNDPVWFKEYSAKEAYSMKGLYPHDWDDLIHRMDKDDALFNKFYYYHAKSPIKSGACDASCKKSTLCGLKTGRTDDSADRCSDL